jgi:hypothetical protein
LKARGHIEDLAALLPRWDAAILVCRDRTSDDCPACILVHFDFGGFFLRCQYSSKQKANWMQQIGFLLQNLLFAQHVSDTIMPIIRSSIFIQMVAAYGTWRFGLQVVGLGCNPDA